MSLGLMPVWVVWTFLSYAAEREIVISNVKQGLDKIN